MSDKNYSGVVCKGSILLGNACGTCDKCIDERKKLENTHESTNYDNGNVIIVSSNGKSLNDFNKTTLEKIKNAAFVLIDGDMVLKNSYGPNGRIINTDTICKGSPYLGTGCINEVIVE